MVKFINGGFEQDFGEWSRHHKNLSVPVRIEYENGDLAELKDQKSRELINELEDRLVRVPIHVRRKQNNEEGTQDRKEIETAQECYLPLGNREYQTANIKYYATGAMNTKQTCKYRMVFQIEDNQVVIAHTVSGIGSYAAMLSDIFDSLDSIEDVLWELCEHDDSLATFGVESSEEDENELNFMAVTEGGQVFQMQLTPAELIKHLINLEVYEFNQEIVD